MQGSVRVQIFDIIYLIDINHPINMFKGRYYESFKFNGTMGDSY